MSATGSRPFRFGVVAATLHDARSWRALAREVEGLGYSTLYLPDSSSPQMAPLSGLSVAAACTTRLRVGMLVANNEMRHPAVLAREVATLDVLSGGRVEWGMGAGWYPPDHLSIGLPFDPPGVRAARLIEAVGLMQQIFTGDPVTRTGRHYRVADLRGGPRPLQQPHPPLLVGAAERRLLTFAGATADIVNVNRSFSTVPFGGRPPQVRPDVAVDRQVGWIREGAGARMAGIEIGMEVNPPLVVTGDPASALDRLAAATGLDPDRLAADPRTWVGSVASIVEALRGHRDRFGVSHWVVYEPYLREAAPIVAALSGE